MRTSALFGAKNFRCFEIYGVFAQIRRERVEPVQTFFWKRREESIFRDFVLTSCKDVF